jgi:hypothetical protein
MGELLAGRDKDFILRKFTILDEVGKVVRTQWGLGGVVKGEIFTAEDTAGEPSIDPKKIWIAETDASHNKFGVLEVIAHLV